MTTFLVIFGLWILIWIYSFFSVLTNNFKEGNDKVVWILLLIFLPITAILYPFIGRKQLKSKDNFSKSNSATPNITSKETSIIKSKGKSKFLAIFLNMLSLGMGYLYVGNIKRALLFSILVPLLIYLEFYLATIYSNIYTVILNYSSIVLIYIYSIYDILNIFTKKEIKSIRYNKWYFMIIFYIIYISYFIFIKTHMPIQLFNIEYPSSMRPTLVKGDEFLVKKNELVPHRGEIVIFRYPKNIKLHYVKRCVAIPGDQLFLHNKNLYLHPYEGKAYILKHYKGDTIIKKDGILWVKNPYMKLYPGIHHDPAMTHDTPVLLSSNGGMEIINTPMKYNYILQNINRLPSNIKLLKHNPVFDTPIIKVPKDDYYMMGDNRDHSDDSRFFGVISQKFVVGTIKSIYINFSDLSRTGLDIK